MSTVPVPLMMPGVQDPHDPGRLGHLPGAHAACRTWCRLDDIGVLAGDPDHARRPADAHAARLEVGVTPGGAGTGSGTRLSRNWTA